MQDNGPDRVYRARTRRQPWPMIWAWTLALGRQVAEAIISILFLVTLGYLVGIGFGIGLVMMYLWI